MPQRSAVVKVKTPIQGDDAWAVIKQPTYGDIRRLSTAVKSVDVKVENLTENLDFTSKLITDFVLQWNWVDNDGNPLPQVSSDPKVIDELTTEEVQQLCELVMDGEKIKKNKITS